MFTYILLINDDYDKYWFVISLLGSLLVVTLNVMDNFLQDFLKYNESYLKQLPCQIFDPIPLGEGAGVGWLKDVDSMAVPEGTMLYELVKTGIEQTHAAVGVVVRLRKELSLVKDMPVLIAIDQVRIKLLVVKMMFFF